MAKAVAPKGPGIPTTDLFSWRQTWIILFARESVYIGVNENTNVSYFILYIGLDSCQKGPRSSNIDLFGWRHTLIITFAMSKSFCNRNSRYLFFPLDILWYVLCVCLSLFKWIYKDFSIQFLIHSFKIWLYSSNSCILY